MNSLNKIYAATVCLVLCLFLGGACDKSANDRPVGGDIQITDSIPSRPLDVEVPAVTLTPEISGLIVMWTPPEEQVASYLVEWKTLAGSEVYSESVTGRTSYKITRLLNEQYEVKVKCLSDKLQTSKGVSQTGAPIFDHTAPGEVTDVTVNAVATTAGVSWTVPSDGDFEQATLLVFQKETPSDTIFYADKLTKYDCTKSVFNLKVGTDYVCEIKTMDYVGNVSAGLATPFSTLAEKELPNNGVWSIFDYSSDQQGCCDATNLIDKNINSPWYSGADRGTFPLPQYITVDLKQKVTLTAAILYRNGGYEINQKNKVQLLGCAETPTATTEWIDLGTYEIEGTRKDSQTCFITELHEVRYLRINVLATSSGWAQLDNLEVRCLDQ